MICPDERATVQVAISLGRRLRAGAIVAIDGTLGVGKTTFVKGLAQGIGITDPIVSPTFTIIHEYRSAICLYHIDLYRIHGNVEAEALDIAAYLYDTGICAIEWPKPIITLLPSHTINVTITLDKGGARLIDIREPASR